MKKWFNCALIRANRTMAQSAIAMIGTSVVLIGGLPEAKEE